MAGDVDELTTVKRTKVGDVDVFELNVKLSVQNTVVSETFTVTKHDDFLSYHSEGWTGCEREIIKHVINETEGRNYPAFESFKRVSELDLQLEIADTIVAVLGEENCRLVGIQDCNGNAYMSDRGALYATPYLLNAMEVFKRQPLTWRTLMKNAEPNDDVKAEMLRVITEAQILREEK